VSDLQKDNNIKASSGREGTIIQRLQMRDMRGNKMTPQNLGRKAMGTTSFKEGYGRR